MVVVHVQYFCQVPLFGTLKSQSLPASLNVEESWTTSKLVEELMKQGIMHGFKAVQICLFDEGWSNVVRITEDGPIVAESRYGIVICKKSHGSPELSPSDPQGPEAKIVEKLKNYVYVIDGASACATAIEPFLLATCYHCIKSLIVPNPALTELDCHRNAVIPLKHESGKCLEARIKYYSVENDLAFLQTSTKLMEEAEIVHADVWIGLPYYLLGTLVTDDGSPLQVLSGRISGKIQHTTTIKSYTFHGHGSARPGASGGPVFARNLECGKPLMIGIVQGGQTIHGSTELNVFVSANYVKIFSSATIAIIYSVLKMCPDLFKF